MRFRIRLIIFLILLSALYLPYAPVQAFPPLPSSIYGVIKVNGANVPDGTRVEAMVDGAVVAYAASRTYEGSSVYSLDVPGDDSSTAAVEGGREGGVITFRVGGVAARETGTWRSGTHAQLDLSVTAATAIASPQPTRTPLPTQTAIRVEPRATAIVTPAAPLAVHVNPPAATQVSTVLSASDAPVTLPVLVVPATPTASPAVSLTVAQTQPTAAQAALVAPAMPVAPEVPPSSRGGWALAGSAAALLTGLFVAIRIRSRK